MAWSIRARLTLWYTGALVLALLVQGVAVYLLQHQLALEDLDNELRQDLETVSHSIAAEFDGGVTWPEAVKDAMREMLLPERQMAVFCGAELLGESPAGAGAQLAAVIVGDPRTLDLPSSSESWRAAAAPLKSPRANCRAVVAHTMTPVLQTRGIALRAVGAGLLLAASVAAIGGFWLARRGLRPLTRLAQECERIPALGKGSIQEGTARLTSPRTGDELDRVVDAFNGLLGRLEHLLNTQRQFMADASHELRTPVSVVRNAAEVALNRERRDAADYRESLDIVAKQARRMTRLVDDLFLLARVDAGQRPLVRGRVYVDDLLRESVDALAYIAHGRGVAIEADLEPDVEVEGDEHLLRQLVVNVLQNAVTYTRADSRVTVQLRRRHEGTGESRSEGSDETIEVTVADEGPGIPAEYQQRVFERFVRLPYATERGHAVDGAGLGLAIARAIAELHGGTLTLRSSGASGTVFAIVLPIASPLDSRDEPTHATPTSDGPDPASSRRIAM
jgi:signal transduction histidine kinase